LKNITKQCALINITPAALPVLYHSQKSTDELKNFSNVGVLMNFSL
jgi:hypothetical protein